jgi:hypothetical protein
MVSEASQLLRIKILPGVAHLVTQERVAAHHAAPSADGSGIHCSCRARQVSERGTAWQLSGSSEQHSCSRCCCCVQLCRLAAHLHVVGRLMPNSRSQEWHLKGCVAAYQLQTLRVSALAPISHSRPYPAAGHACRAFLYAANQRCKRTVLIGHVWACWGLLLLLAPAAVTASQQLPDPLLCRWHGCCQAADDLVLDQVAPGGVQARVKEAVWLLSTKSRVGCLISMSVVNAQAVHRYCISL